MKDVLDIIFYSIYAAICIGMAIAAIYGIVKIITKITKENNNYFNTTIHEIVKMVEDGKHWSPQFTELLETFCDVQGFDSWSLGTNSTNEKNAKGSIIAFFKNGDNVFSLDIDNHKFITGDLSVNL